MESRQEFGGSRGPMLSMSRIAEHAMSLVDCAAGAAVVIEESGLLVTVAAAGIAVGHVGDLAEVGETFSGLALYTGRPAVCDDIAAEPRVWLNLRADRRARSMISVPLFDAAEPIGVLVIVARETRAFTPVAQARVRRAAAVVSAALSAVIDQAAAPVPLTPVAS